MNYDFNLQRLNELKGKKLHLFDSSVFVRSEEIFKVSGVDFIDSFQLLEEEYFFVSNEALMELSNGPRRVNFKSFLNHILNVEGGMDKKWKENRFIIEKDGRLGYIVLNKISSIDYLQVLLCQNHPTLTLVSSDRKLLKSAAQIIPGRVLGFPVLVERLTNKYPKNKDIKVINETIKNIYEMKNALDRSKKIK